MKKWFLLLMIVPPLLLFSVFGYVTYRDIHDDWVVNLAHPSIIAGFEKVQLLPPSETTSWSSYLQDCLKKSGKQCSLKTVARYHTTDICENLEVEEGNKETGYSNCYIIAAIETDNINVCNQARTQYTRAVCHNAYDYDHYKKDDAKKYHELLLSLR